MDIDLRSDTVTKPTPGMLDAMFHAAVGDDVFSEDPTVNALQEKAAAIFGMEAALFCPSGTMTNQIALRVHTQPGDEVICDQYAHVYRYESGGMAANAGCSVRLVTGDRGRITAQDVLNNINPGDDHFPFTRLVCLENTANKGGGSYYTLESIRQIRTACNDHDLLLHLDGARLFNALVETGDAPKAYGDCFDSISLCLSKGLGTPAGSLVLGSKDFIKAAHRKRKMMGGGMRQAGYLAAAGIYALDHHISRLTEDHARAKAISEVLQSCYYVKQVLPVETNIIVFELTDQYNTDIFLEALNRNGIKAVAFGPQLIRFVTHLDFNDDMLDRTITVLKGL